MRRIRGSAATFVILLAAMSPIVSTTAAGTAGERENTTDTGDNSSDLGLRGPDGIGWLQDDQELARYQDDAIAAGALGFYRDDATSSLVMLVPRQRELSFDLGKLGPAPALVKVIYSDLDPAAVAAASERLLGWPKDQALAKASMAFFFRPETQKIHVTTSVDAAILFKYMGDSASLIEYEYGNARALARTNDSSPFWGGAKSHWQQDPDPNNYCTTGFTVADSGGTRHLVQPAHCGNVGGTVKNWVLTQTVGTYGNKHCGNVGALDNSDVQWISGQSYAPSIYVGDLAGSQANVLEAGTAGTGVAYRYSGATTGEKLNQVIISTDASLWWASDNDWCDPDSVGGWWQLHLLSFNRSGVCDAQGGDSGAPIYTRYGGTPPQVGIRGMATAILGNTCYGEKWSRIQSLLGGVSIVHV